MTEYALDRRLSQLMEKLRESIREQATVPSRHLYATVQDAVTYDAYESVIDSLVRSGLVKRGSMHLLHWVCTQEEYDDDQLC